MSTQTTNAFAFDYLASKCIYLMGNEYGSATRPLFVKKIKIPSRQMTKQEWTTAVKECKSLKIKL